MGVMFKVKLELQKEGKTLLAKLSLPASLKIAFWECFAKCSTFKHESTRYGELNVAALISDKTVRLSP